MILTNKFRIFLGIIISFCILHSCNTSSQHGNEYLYNLNDELSKHQKDPEKIREIQKRELEKYQKHDELLYLLSSKYSSLRIHNNKREQIKQVPTTFEILKLNQGKFEFFDIACNFNLAFQFEKVSPEQSLIFLNKAIEISEKTDEKVFRPHMYHLKGTWYYKKENYDQAIFYFRKAIDNYKNEKGEPDTLYIASMYNNIGMSYEKMKNLKLAIENVTKGINVLKEKRKPNDKETFFVHFFEGNLGQYLFETHEYSKAEKLLVKEWEYYKKDNEKAHNFVGSSKRLISLYDETNQLEEKKRVIRALIDIQPKLKYISYKITVNEVLQDYYAQINDIENLKNTSEILKRLNTQANEINEEELNNISDILYEYMLKNINQEHAHKISDNKNTTLFLLIISGLVIMFSFWLVYSIKNKKNREKELLEKQNDLLESNKIMLEQDIQLQKEKNKNLHLNLNLKIETEKAFLENLKKLRKTKNMDVEQILKDLQFQINNLIQIDKKNYDFINESSIENKIFIQKLSNLYPSLTEQDLKLCVYFKLNLSSKEISLLENITSGSVRVYKTKIKSKIGLSKDNSLNSFLSSI